MPAGLNSEAMKPNTDPNPGASDQTDFESPVMNSEAIPPSKALVLTAAGGRDEDYRLFEESETLGEGLKRFGLLRIPQHLARVPPRSRERFLNAFVRWCEPWPEWVLRIAAEVLHVYFPTIPKKTIKAGLQKLHFFLFGLRLNEKGFAELETMLKVDAAVYGAMLGHFCAWMENSRRNLDRELAKGLISPDQHLEYAKLSSLEFLQAQVAEPIADFLKSNPDNWLAGVTAFAKAKASTFDRSGSCKETTSTRVYYVILRNWPEIEELSGPTALAHFLRPVLEGSENDPEKRLDRVKKVCRRMGITFKPFVKGQTHPPGLSLPPKT